MMCLQLRDTPTRCALCLRDELSKDRLRQVLELGCGTGKNTQWLVERASVTGLDFSTAMLSRCRDVAPFAQLYQADINLPWPVDSNGFDTVLANLVLEHIDDLSHIAREAKRVLRPGGRFRLSELHPARQKAGKRAHFEADGQLFTPDAFTHSVDEYIRTFVDQGFSLDAQGEARLPSDEAGRPPRLLILTFSLSGED